MTRVKQQGSVVGFVVVGIVLAALVLGGIYFVRTDLAERLTGGPSLDQAADEASEGVEDAVTPGEDEGDEPAQPPEDEDRNSAEEAPAEEPTAPRPDDGTDDRVARDDNEDLPTAGVDVELPQTGPADFMVGALPVAALVGAVLVYRRSNML